MNHEIIGVMGNSECAPCCYTKGLDENLIIVGLEIEWSASLLNEIIEKGDAVAGTTISGLANVDFEIRLVSKTKLKEYMGESYDPTITLQVTCPDEDGLYPWELGYALEHVQPNLVS